MPHDDFLKVAAKAPKKKSRRPEHGVRGIALKLADGTCALLNFDTGEVDVWIVGEVSPEALMIQARNVVLASATDNGKSGLRRI